MGNRELEVPGEWKYQNPHTDDMIILRLWKYYTKKNNT